MTFWFHQNSSSISHRRANTKNTQKILSANWWFIWDMRALPNKLTSSFFVLKSPILAALRPRNYRARMFSVSVCRSRKAKHFFSRILFLLTHDTTMMIMVMFRGSFLEKFFGFFLLCVLEKEFFGGVREQTKLVMNLCRWTVASDLKALFWDIWIIFVTVFEVCFRMVRVIFCCEVEFIRVDFCFEVDQV
jgi:hypothetical protein